MPKTKNEEDTKRKSDAADWLLQIKLSENRNERWAKRCEKIIKRYRQDTGDGVDSSSGLNVGGARRMNMLWSNVQTLQPCVYGRQPVPIAERRFLDKDDTGRNASTILERTMRYEINFCGFNEVTEQCVLDYLLPGRGVSWWRYVPVIGPASGLTDEGDDQITEDAEGQPPDEEVEEGAETPTDDNEPTDLPRAEKVLTANVEMDYIYWKDFNHSRARFWREVTWISRTLYPSREDLIDDFGKEIGEAVPLELTPELSKDMMQSMRAHTMPDTLKKAIVYEIWDKNSRKVYTVAKGYDDFLEVRDDPLRLEGFFPCPKPLFATMTNDSLEPVPDYIEYQDQALEIDNLTMRIDGLMAALKVVGVYDASVKQLARILDEGGENKMIPVPNWAAFAQKGGLAASVSFLPIKEVADTLMQLFDSRDKIKQDLFEVTGMSDIIRGQADPRETATAVQTKGRWGSLRLQARQANVARFCKDNISIMGEIIAEHFPSDTLVNVSGAMYDEGIGGSAPTPPAPQQAPKPMMGHNGGPPMGGPSPQMGAPPVNPMGGMPGQPMPAPQAQPGLMPSALPPPPIGQAGIPMQAPMAPPDPMAVYAMQMQAYQQKKMMAINKAIDLLRQDKLRGFRIDIETDSSINTEANEEKQARIQFVEALTKFMQEAMNVGNQVPEAVPILGKSLLFAVRGFRAGRDLEASIEEFVEQMEKLAKQKIGQPPPPSPEMQKAQLEMQITKEKGQMDLQTAIAKSKAEVARAQIDSQASAEDNQREMATKAMDGQLNQQKMNLEMEQMRQEMTLKTMEFDQRMKEMQMKMTLAEHDHGLKREAMDAQHRHSLEKMNREKEGME